MSKSIWKLGLCIAICGLGALGQAPRPPAIVSILVCSPSGAGGPGSCPNGSLDTHQIVLAPDWSGNAINSYSGMIGVSDEHQSIFSPGTLQANADYLFVVATRTTGGAPGAGVVFLSGGSGPGKNGQWTMDFPKADGYGSYPKGYGTVFVAPTGPNCPTPPGNNAALQDQTFDLGYAAPGSVVIDPSGAPGHLLMIYEGTNTCFGITSGPNGGGFYSTVGVATSWDYGHTWPTYRAKSGFDFVPLPAQNSSQGPQAPTGNVGSSVCAGNDCTAMPPASYGRYAVLSPSVPLATAMASGKPLPSSLGDSEMAAFVDDARANSAQYLYAVYNYHNSTGTLFDPKAAKSDLMIARAALNGGTATLSFSKWDGRAFAGAGLGGYDSPIFPLGPFENCEAADQLRTGASVSYVEDTQQYLLTFVCGSPGDPARGQTTGTSRGAAWFYSTSYDISDPSQWSTPQEIAGSWSEFDTSGGCDEYKGWYPTFMSPNHKPGHLSTNGYAFYLWGCQTGNTPAPGRQYSSRAFTITTTAGSSEMGFAIGNRGGASLTSSGTGSSVSLGYAGVQPNARSTAPSGVAIFDFQQNNVLVSEVGVPATPALLSGRIYAEIAGPVSAGLAIANPNSTPAAINFYFTDANGNSAGSGTVTMAPNQQIAQFLDQSPFKVYTTPAFQGTFSFTSNVPVAVVALRGFTNERGDFLMSTLPVIDLTAAPNGGPTVVPHFADGGGWITQVLLVNPTDNPMAGTLQFMNQAGAAANVTIGTQTNSSFSYSIPRRTSQKLSTLGLSPITASGSIRIIPTGSGPGPTPLVVFSYKPSGFTLSEAGVQVASGNAFRIYVESSGLTGQPGNIQSGIAVANTSSASASVIFDLTDLTGAAVAGVSPVTVPLAGSAQTAKYLGYIFSSVPNPFKGVLRITTTSGGLSVVGLRIRFNQRGDLLFTTTPPADENAAASSSALFFPQVADGGGYTTQFILFSGAAGQTASGTLQLFEQSGTPLGVTLK